MLGDAIEASRAIARRVLPEGVTLTLSGQAERMQEGVSQAGAGMFSSTVLTLLVVPVFYLAIDDSVEWVKGRLRRLVSRKKEVAA